MGRAERNPSKQSCGGRTSTMTNGAGQTGSQQRRDKSMLKNRAPRRWVSLRSTPSYVLDTQPNLNIQCCGAISQRVVDAGVAAVGASGIAEPAQRVLAELLARVRCQCPSICILLFNIGIFPDSSINGICPLSTGSPSPTTWRAAAAITNCCATTAPSPWTCWRRSCRWRWSTATWRSSPAGALII